MREDIVPPKRPDGVRQRPRAAPNTARSAQQAPVPSSIQSPQEPALTASAHETGSPKTATRREGVGAADILHDDIEHSDTRTKRGMPSRRMLGLLAGLLLGLTAFISAVVWYNYQLTAVESSNQEKIKIVIEPGSDQGSIAAMLRQNDLIRNELAFEVYLRLSGKSGSLQSGAYRLSKSEDVPKIVGHMTSGNTDTFSLTFLPGATLNKHKQVLLNAGFDEGSVDAALAKSYERPLFDGKPATADLEGYIYGETYNFPSEATPEDVLTRIFDEYESVITKNDLVASYKRQGFSLYQGITMASIIQREVATPADAAQVAQVFKLRYDQGMQLGSDVTYQYIADKTGQQRSVDLDSPYNTRRYAGLPPGPISSPGLSALKAVASPAPGDFVYFLSGDDDKTYFARTNEEHEQNIRNYCEKKCQII